MILPSLLLLAALAAQPAPVLGRVCVRDAQRKPIPSLLILTRDKADKDGPQLTTGPDGCVAVPATLDPAAGPWKVFIALQTYVDVKVRVPAPGVTRRITLKHDADTSLNH